MYNHLSQKDLNLVGEAGTNFNSNFDGSLPYKNVKRKRGHFFNNYPFSNAVAILTKPGMMTFLVSY